MIFFIYFICTLTSTFSDFGGSFLLFYFTFSFRFNSPLECHPPPWKTRDTNPSGCSADLAINIFHQDSRIRPCGPKIYFGLLLEPLDLDDPKGKGRNQRRVLAGASISDRSGTGGVRAWGSGIKRRLTGWCVPRRSWCPHSR